MIPWTRRDHEEWTTSYADLLDSLSRFGQNNAIGQGDFWLLDEDWENREHVIHLDNLELLERGLVQQIRTLLLGKYPHWVASITIIPPTNQVWPNMGLLVTRDAVEDHLDRRVLPERIAKLRF